jgi:hypothetical protein
MIVGLEEAAPFIRPQLGLRLDVGKLVDILEEPMIGANSHGVGISVSYSTHT